MLLKINPAFNPADKSMDDYAKEWSTAMTNDVNPEFSRFKKAFEFSREQVRAGKSVVMIGRPTHTLNYRLEFLLKLSVHE